MEVDPSGAREDVSCQWLPILHPLNPRFKRIYRALGVEILTHCHFHLRSLDPPGGLKLIFSSLFPWPALVTLCQWTGGKKCDT